VEEDKDVYVAEVVEKDEKVDTLTAETVEVAKIVVVEEKDEKALLLE
jgi:hypothetical protein